MAVVYTGGYSSELTSSLGTSIRCTCNPKKKKGKKKVPTQRKEEVLDCRYQPHPAWAAAPELK